MPILKRIIAVFLIVTMLLQTLSLGLTLVTFQINRSYYANVLCINKNRPELACGGKCVLMMRLKQEYDKEQTSQHQTLKNIFDRELTLFCNTYKPLTFHYGYLEISTNTKLNPNSKNFIAQCALCDIFHPPNYTA